jgi:hypothetical protein
VRDYGRVYSSFWQSPEMRALPEDARALALYLLTTPHGNLIGCFRLPEAYAAEDLQWEPGRVAEGFARLVESGFVTRDEATKWLHITKFLKWNAFENPNVAKAAHKAFDQVPALSLKPALALALLESGVHTSGEFRKACETLIEAFRKPEPEPEPIRNLTGTKPEPDVSAGVADATPTAPKKPRKPKPETPPSAEAWNAYASAYKARYGELPVRNAKVNGQMAQFVARIGAEEAPAVAAFFVGHQNAFYVRQMHPVDSLLRDAEKLRTEWATGRQVTQTQAAQVDRTQTNLSAFAPLLAEARAREAKERDDAERRVA